ncbi:MAG TPA: DUF3320 domain-containing protein, partial [Flavisolibacter sp.]|nr:DUF3320 domain-containing protein [Flavisolibacter sp.]
DLHQELKRVVELGKPQVQKLQEEVGLLGKYKKEVNDYSIAMNTPIGKSGVTVHQVYGYLLQIESQTGGRVLPRIQLPEPGDRGLEDQVRAEAVADRVEARLKDIGVPSQMLFWGSALKVLLPQDVYTLKEALQHAIQSVERLRRESHATAQRVGLEAPLNREKTIDLATMLQLASAAPDLRQLAVEHHDWLLRSNDIEELLSIGTRVSTLKSDFTDIFLPEAWDVNVLDVRRSLMEHGTKWYKFLIGDYNKAVKVLKSLCKVTIPKRLDQKIEYVDAILEHKRLLTALSEHEELAKALFGLRWQKTGTAWEQLEAAAIYLKSVHQQVAHGSCDKRLLAYLAQHQAPSWAKEAYESLFKGLNEQATKIQTVEEALKLGADLKFQNKSLVHLDYESLIHKLTEWNESARELQLTVSWNNLVDIAKESTLQCLTDAVVDWAEGKDYLKAALQKTWYEYVLEQAIHSSDSLRQFERVSHEEAIKQFRKLDLLSLRFNRAQAALKHWTGMPNLDAGGQLSILKTEFNRKARHLPIRKLMQEAGQAIQAIKPVCMMSPLSIANFLAPGVLEFDLVIFDEASQVRPVEALGAILRGRQLVVVGDTRQLPPTSFFDTLNDNIEDEENVTADLQSILGMCDAQGAPQKMLRWHYRSRHESLINLSNHEFYENRLVVFPSPGSKHNLGLIFHHLSDTAYDRGGTRTNPKEAQTVAAAVMEHARKYPKLSLGVAAFSSAQREAIQNALELLRRASPDCEDYFKSHTDEPFFIKNLENVQGDERDVIFISIGYGRTQEGYVSMSFGPLNNEGGEKRLNVLITRAKLRCEVFTNLTSDDIDTSKSQTRGIRALKSFLHFAQHGKLDIPVETGNPFDSPFEEKVYDELVHLGYTVRQQVGSKGFYLDLAIVDPQHPGRYLLGVECDGAAYHSARSARDRDRLRQQVLEGIGWRIHRVWSTDWFRNPDKELRRVVEAIEKAKLVYQAEDEVTGEEEVIESHFAREHSSDDEGVPLYEAAVLPAEIASKELHMHSVGALAGWIVDVATKESPVHFDEVARRMAEAAGITRVGARIRSQLFLATKFAEGSKKITRRGDFLWAAEMQVPVIRDRSTLGAGSRKLKYIAPEELSLGAQKIISDSIAIERDEAISMIARLFGFSRVTEEMRKELLEVIRLCINDGKVAVDGTVLKQKFQEVT